MIKVVHILLEILKARLKYSYIQELYAGIVNFTFAFAYADMVVKFSLLLLLPEYK